MTFLNPLLLIGALGIALPILAHLINRQQVQRTDWAAMQFLNRTMRVRSRQIRLRDILLLLMRCLAVLALIFALARPATTGKGGSWLPGETRAGVVFAIDGSFSMAHREGNTTRFERALEQAAVIRDSIKPGDPVSLVLLGGENEVLLRNVAYDPERFEQVLTELKPTPQAMNLDSVPKHLGELVDNMDAVQKEVYLITDTQAQDWQPASAPLRDALMQLSSNASVFMVPIKGSDANLAVTGLDLLSGSLRNGATARYRATVHNFGTSPAANVEVRCKVEGVQIDSKRIPLIAPGNSETVSLFVPFYNAGPTRITAEITDETLVEDNIRRTVAVVRERVSVLCLDGSGGNAGRLVTAGLLARSSGTEDQGFTVRTVQWPAFPTEGLDGFDVVILTDVPEITSQQAEDLSRFVRRGNGLVWFAGENVKQSAWNQLNEQDGSPLLPAKLGTAIDARDNLGVGKPLSPTMPDHTIARPLQSLPEDLLSETRFLKRIQVEPVDTSFTVLNLAGTISPILIEQSLGRGHVFMFTTSADTAWNNMALTPTFPMLMQHMVTYLSGRAFDRPRTVGDTLTLTYVDQPDANDAVFETPSDETITVPVSSHRSQYVALLEASNEAGFYTAKVSVQAPGMPIAVNVDTRESDVTSLEEAVLAERLADTGFEIATSQGDLAAGISMARTGRSSWRFFMLAALLLLLGESLLADRTHGRKSKRASSIPTTPQPAGVS
ncbi:MAG: BatA domain-containing protein [Planctomycetota bacterium]